MEDINNSFTQYTQDNINCKYFISDASSDKIRNILKYRVRFINELDSMMNKFKKKFKFIEEKITNDITRDISKKYSKSIRENIDFAGFDNFDLFTFYHIKDNKLQIGKITQLSMPANSQSYFEGTVNDEKVIFEFSDVCIIANEYFESDCNILNPDCGENITDKLRILFDKLIIQ